MTRLVSWPGENPPVASPLDPDAVEAFTFDFNEWLTAIGATGLDASTITATAGLVVGNGVLVASTKSGNLVPPAPVIAEGKVTAYLWPDTAQPNSWATLSCHVTSGSQALERSVVFQLRHM